MKKLFFSAFSLFVMGSLAVSAQTEADMIRPTGAKVFKVYSNPTTDKSDQFEIQGLGGTTFLASNITDGTANSYRHTLQVNVTLVPTRTGTNNFQLVFYSESQNIPEAANYTDGVLNIYYPISFYQGIREKLEQALAARKKVYVKVVQKPNGYREGSLIF